jgi:hypothetical protein
VASGSYLLHQVLWTKQRLNTPFSFQRGDILPWIFNQCDPSI